MKKKRKYHLKVMGVTSTTYLATTSISNLTNSFLDWQFNQSANPLPIRQVDWYLFWIRYVQQSSQGQSEFFSSRRKPRRGKESEKMKIQLKTQTRNQHSHFTKSVNKVHKKVHKFAKQYLATKQGIFKLVFWRIWCFDWLREEICFSLVPGSLPIFSLVMMKY